MCAHCSGGLYKALHTASHTVTVQTAQSVGDVTPPPTTAIMADWKWVLSHVDQ